MRMYFSYLFLFLYSIASYAQAPYEIRVPGGVGDVIFDGGTNGVAVDKITEKTTDAGVDVDGVLLKDGDVG